ncbi:cupin, partial [Modestobacter versicolor]
ELKVGDLPGLDAADQLTLARRLVTESIAVVPDARAGSTGHDGGRGDTGGA